MNNPKEELHPLASRLSGMIDSTTNPPTLSGECFIRLRQTLLEIEDGHELAHAVRSVLRVAWAVEQTGAVALAQRIGALVEAVESSMRKWSDLWLDTIADGDRALGRALHDFRDDDDTLPNYVQAKPPPNSIPIRSLYEPDEMSRRRAGVSTSMRRMALESR